MLFGTVPMQTLLLVLSLYAFQEFARAVGLSQERSYIWLGRVCIALVYLPVFIKSFGFFMSMPAYAVLIVFLLPIFRDKYEGMVQRTVLTIIGVIYFGWFLAYLAYLMNIETGRQLILAFMLIVIMNDAGAYVIGTMLGHHRLRLNDLHLLVSELRLHPPHLYHGPSGQRIRFVLNI